MDTKALRQKILDLAIRGKLVPQDPNDEPASVLLERIREEKERLIREGKIKRPKSSRSTCGSKKSQSSDTRHYANAPFGIPDSWEWARLEDVTKSITDGDHQSPPQSKDGVPFLVISNVISGNINFQSTRHVPEDYFHSISQDRKPSKGDILLTVTGSYGTPVLVNTTKNFCFQRHIALLKPLIIETYLMVVLGSKYFKKVCDDNATGTAQLTVGLETLRNTNVPIPPIQEQIRIVKKVNELLCEISTLKDNQDNLALSIESIKSKILSLAIQGKLVEQDPDDEPAIELLRRVNKGFRPCDTSHYGNIPNGWVECKFEDVVDYKQPQNYIVESTDYSDKYDTPVLTAGKSFIIGYTKETKGIFRDVPVIIFDDFTTDSKLVDFPFKVKSSAMKILSVNAAAFIEYIALLMSITRLVGETHKRYWISEYSKIHILLPPVSEQHRIVATVKSYFNRLEEIEHLLN